MDTLTKTEKAKKRYTSLATPKSFVTRIDTNKPRQLECLFCKNGHYSNQFTEVTGLRKKWKQGWWTKKDVSIAFEEDILQKIVEARQNIISVREMRTRQFVTNWKQQLLEEKNHSRQNKVNQ